jgi:metal-responsive CopG/Arc/MetJ family transcriptional regulator
MAKESDEKQMIHMRMDQSILKRLDDFRFKHRFQSRSDAARWLLNWALDQKPKPEDRTR